MWSSGETIVVRYRSIDGAFRAARPLTVVEDGPEWLVTHLPENTVVAVPVLAEGAACVTSRSRSGGRTRGRPRCGPGRRPTS